MTVLYKGRHVFERLAALSTEGILAGYAQNPLATHYYVDDQNGNDKLSGLSPNVAKLTLQAAIDLCTDWKGDVIHVTRGTQTVTTPVLFNKKGIMVIADILGNPGAMGEAHVIYGSHTDGPAAQVLAPCVLVGLGFCGSQTAGASLELAYEGTESWEGAFSLLKACRFSHWGIAKAYALLVKGTGDNRVEDCMFDGLWTGYTTSAIYAQMNESAAVWNLTLEGNRFYNIGSGKYCIQVKAVASTLRQCLIKENYNIGPVATRAKFFASGAVAGDGLIADNYTGQATDTDSYDRTVAQLETHGYAVSNNHYLE